MQAALDNGSFPCLSCRWMFVGVQPKLGGYSAGLFTMIDQLSKGGGAPGAEARQPCGQHACMPPALASAYLSGR
jgi:hypothetical protein